MRSLPALLLAAALAAAGDAPTFELGPPRSDDWDTKAPDGKNVMAYLRTEFADSNPKATAEIRVMVYPLSTALETRGLDAIAHDWAPTIESEFKDPVRVDEGKSKLGQEEAWVRDVRTSWARLTWHLARRGEHLYVFHVIRTNKAVDDGSLAQEIDAMCASFRFLEQEKQPPPACPPEPGRRREPPTIEEEKLPRETLTFDHWRLECVKPEGLRKVDPEKLDQAEKDAGVVAKFERVDGQTRIMVRIYARSRSAEPMTIEKLAEQKLKRFEDTYDETHRNPPLRDDRWKFPMAERAIRLELTGRALLVQVTRWYLAECRNDRQYQIEIYVSGAEERWSKEIEELLKGFRPLRG